MKLLADFAKYEPKTNYFGDEYLQHKVGTSCRFQRPKTETAFDQFLQIVEETGCQCEEMDRELGGSMRKRRIALDEIPNSRGDILDTNSHLIRQSIILLGTIATRIANG